MVYSYVIMFTSVVEDKERNNGYDHPYFMSNELKKLLGVKNKFEDTDAPGDSNILPNPIQMESVETVQS